MDTKPKVLPELARHTGRLSRYRMARRRRDLAPAPNPHKPADRRHGPASLAATPPRLVGLLAFDNACLQQYEHDLASFGFTVRPCHDVEELRATALRESLTAVALVAPLLDIHMAIAQLRIASPDIGIVAVADFPDRQSRVGALLSGADACVDMAPDALEVAAVLLAFQRRRHDNAALTDPAASPPAAWSAQAASAAPSVPAPPSTPASAPPYTPASIPASAPAPASTPSATPASTPRYASSDETSSQWRLVDKGWTLASPDGRHLILTSAERRLMLALVASPNRTINRDTQLHPQGHAHAENQDPAKARRYLDVLVSRLRRKAALQSMDLPIRSVRGEGYSFVSECLGP